MILTLPAAAAFLLLRQRSAPGPESRIAAAPASIPENLAAGDLIDFGTYEQDNDRDNGPEPVAWY